MPAPAGILRPSALAIARGLSFAQAFQNGGTPWILRGTVPGAFVAGATAGVARAGIGMRGVNGYWGTGTGVGSTYSINPTEGTLLVFTRPDFISSDATAPRMAFSMANNYPTGPGIEWLKYTDGNCYVGKIDAGDKRVTFSNSGLWAAGDDVVLGYTWAATGQIAYVNGRNVGSNASTGSSVTSGQPFNVGQLATNGWYWNTTTNGAIYYAILLDRAFSASEIASASADPWWWVETSIPRVGAGTAYPLDAQPVGYKYTPGAVGLEYRRTLDARPVGYQYSPAPVDFIARRTLAAEGVVYHYAPANVALNYYPATDAGDTHDGFIRRTRRQRALDAAERQRRSEAAQEAVALRLSLEAAMGLAAEVVEDAPQPVADVVGTATREAARFVPMLARGPAPEVLQAANDAIVALRSAIAAADRARMLAEDDEDVLMLLRAL